MSPIKSRFIILSSLLLLSATLFAGGEQEDESNNTKYFVSILPQAYLLERIGGDRIDVSVMVPPGKSPATYEPTPRQVMELGESRAFFTLDVPFEQNFLHTLESTLPDLPLVNAAEGIEKRYLKAHDHDEDHEEGEHEGEESKDDADHEDHSEEGTLDPHVWLSPVLAQTIARNMTERLIADDPEGADDYRKELDSLSADLKALDEELADILAPLKGEILFVYHPAFGYFAERYGMEQEAIELGGKEPSPAELEEIIQHAREEGVKVILVQPEFSRSSAEAVANAIDGAVIPVETLSGDYLNNLVALATQLRESLQ